MSELSEEQKFSRENFRGLIKNRKSFLTVKVLSFTVFHGQQKLLLIQALKFVWGEERP